jgi:hypothetical protein
MVVRGGESTAVGREPWIITLKSGREIILLVPSTTAKELETMHGYVGRVRPAVDDDHIELDTRSEVQKLKASRGQIQ